MKKQFAIGIDLGTSNSACAISCVNTDEITTIPITQLINSGAIGESVLLPSALYIPRDDEFSAHDLNLPWGDENTLLPRSIIGSMAKDRGASSPDRVVLSAKSWLCNEHVDRKGDILPWRSEAITHKYSPFSASRALLSHIKQAFIYSMGEKVSLDDCAIVLTVPASFDEVARTLTFEAAKEAGFSDITLLEEPQAAFYSWIAQSNNKWRNEIKSGDIVLVCDVGGGTADFSLIVVSESNGELALERISVGNHILLGGDNMDLALAYGLKMKLEESGHPIDSWQFLSIIHSARAAKERLFSDEQINEIPIVVPSRGSSLFAQVVSTVLTREHLVETLVDGFFPLTEITNLPTIRKSVGLQEFGLSFASDPALSKHLAHFLTQSMKNVISDNTRADSASNAPLHAFQIETNNAFSQQPTFIRPTAVLFNGGVFNSNILKRRVISLLEKWNDGAPIKELQSSNLDLAVARGAASYGRLKLGGTGLRIKSGTARSYYLGMEASTLAVPGYQPPIMGICVVPQGTEEGTNLVFEGQEFGLVTGETVEFKFFSSAIRAGDTLGIVINDARSCLEETACLEVTLPALSNARSEVLPVKLSAYVTEMGTLELWMNHVHSDTRWKLEFNVRAQQ